MELSNVCRHWLAGRCWAGENCRFLHPPAEALLYEEEEKRRYEEARELVRLGVRLGQLAAAGDAAPKAKAEPWKPPWLAAAAPVTPTATPTAAPFGSIDLLFEATGCLRGDQVDEGTWNRCVEAAAAAPKKKAPSVKASVLAWVEKQKRLRAESEEAARLKAAAAEAERVKKEATLKPVPKTAVQLPLKRKWQASFVMTAAENAARLKAEEDAARLALFERLASDESRPRTAIAASRVVSRLKAAEDAARLKAEEDAAERERGRIIDDYLLEEN